jgi:hypothetical protein
VEQMGFSALDRGAHRLIPHLVLRAHVKTRSEIGPESRAETLSEASQYFVSGDIHCYCCDTPLWTAKFGRPKSGIPLDHLWPLSLGGSSSSENLLPTCETCNGAKEDRASWSVFGVVQDYAQANRGANSDLLLGLALHQRAATRFAVLSYLTLKKAYIALGPRAALELVDPLDGEHFFNRRAHDVSKLQSLW